MQEPRAQDRLFYNPHDERFSTSASRDGQTFRVTRNLGRARDKRRECIATLRSLFVTRREARVCHGRRERPDGYRWSLDAQIQLVE